MAMGIRSALSSVSWIRIVGECRDGASAVIEVPRSDASLVLINLGLPKLDGVSVTELLTSACPALKIVWFTSRPPVQVINVARSLGVTAVVHKTCTPVELVKSIELAADGKPFFSRTVFARQIPRLQTTPSPQTLSDRQKKVLALVAYGFANKEVADVLGMSTRTVETHCENICKKLGLPNRVSMVRLAIQTGFSL